MLRWWWLVINTKNLDSFSLQLMYWHWTNLVAWPFPFVFFMSTFYFTKLLVTNLSHQYLNVWLLSRTPSDLLSMCIIVSNIMSCKAWTDCTLKVTAMTTNLDILFCTALIITPGFVILEVYWLIIFLFREAARECRRKKKEYVKCLENRVAVLENQNKTLIEELKTLKDLYCVKTG